MPIALRPYQEEAVTSVFSALGQGVRRLLINLPVGAGKTVVAADIAKRFGQRTLFLVHRDELALQANEKFSLVWPDARIGIVKGRQDDVDADVVVASVQTLSQPGRIERLRGAGEFRLVIQDEAHHVGASTFRDVLSGMGSLPETPDGSLLIGLTATPFRSDGEDLGKVFEKIVYRRSIMDLIRQGYLADVRAYRLETKLDLSNVRTFDGDFNERDLALAVNTPKRNQVVVPDTRDSPTVVRLLSLRSMWATPAPSPTHLRPRGSDRPWSGVGWPRLTVGEPWTGSRRARSKSSPTVPC